MAEANYFLASKDDSYLIGMIKEWLEASKTGSKLDLFIEMFPGDEFVMEHQEKNDKVSLNRLVAHMSIIESRLPLKLYFDLNGLSNDKLTKRLAQLIDNEDPEIALRAINTVLKFKFPTEEKTVRISPIQKNTYNIRGNDPDKKTLIKGILDNLKKNDSNETETANSA